MKLKMLFLYSTIIILLKTVNGQRYQLEEYDDQRSNSKSIKLCGICTCSEIAEDPAVDNKTLVLHIFCSGLRGALRDLDKIVWPQNENKLRIFATFERLGMQSMSSLPLNNRVEKLNINNNGIQTYWPDPFKAIPNLKYLSLAHNALEHITPDLFTDINHLVELDLSFNKLSSLNPLDFKYLVDLKKFNLQSNSFKRIPIEALQRLPVLEDLDLSKNSIYDVVLQRRETIKLKALKRLNLSRNKIRTILKDAIPRENRIEYLDLSKNMIEVIEDEAFKYTKNITELNLEKNNLTTIPSLPPNLQVAILGLNYFKEWPTFPWSITYVDLSYNKLTKLYEKLKQNFQSLEELNIAGNQLEEFDLEGSLPKLYTLDLSYNLLENVPEKVNKEQLPNLRELKINGNPIQNLYFPKVLALDRLYMTEMPKLKVIRKYSFWNVFGRNIREKRGGCFSLEMANSPSLQTIEDGAFNRTQLCFLDISNSNFTHLSSELLDWDYLFKHDGINLQNNPWNCSCYLQWLLNRLVPLMYKKTPSLLFEFRCASPRAFEGYLLVHFYGWSHFVMCDETFKNGNRSERSTMDNIHTAFTIALSISVNVAVVVGVSLSIYLARSRQWYKQRLDILNRRYQERLGKLAKKSKLAERNSVVYHTRKI